MSSKFVDNILSYRADGQTDRQTVKGQCPVHVELHWHTSTVARTASMSVCSFPASQRVRQCEE